MVKVERQNFGKDVKLEWEVKQTTRGKNNGDTSVKLWKEEVRCLVKAKKTLYKGIMIPIL